MTPHQILAVCSRLAALIWGLYALSSAPRYFISMGDPPVDNRVTVWIVVGCQIAVCAVLWFFPSAIARKVLPQKADMPIAAPRMLEWQTLGVVCVGLWGLIRAIPDAMYWAVILQTWKTAEFGLTAFTISQKARIASTILELGLALYLVFGARRITNYLFGVRARAPQE